MDDTNAVHALQSQVSVYQEELKSHEESSAELRDSLKEAVALLKTLQDAVAKAEDKKMQLLQQLDVVEEQ
jgi:septal ring factor EnvC (AmiA/AmiB activator)